MTEAGRSLSRHAEKPEPCIQETSVRWPVENPREEELIWLLMAGHTDSSAARRLNVSPRTITYMLRNLMDRLTVNNRFQLGVALGRCEAISRETSRQGQSGGNNTAEPIADSRN